MTTTFFLAQYIYFTLEFGVRSDRSWFAKHHPTTDLGLFNTTEQQTCIVTGFTLIEQFTEHFNASNRRSQRSFHQTNDLDAFTNLDAASFDTTRSNGTTAGNGKYVFNRHKEWQINRAGRQRDISIHSIHQIVNRFYPFCFASECAGRRTLNDRRIVTVETVGSQQIANLHFYQFQQLRIIYQVYLVHENNYTGYTYLAGQEDVFLCLWHGTIRSSHYKDSTVHLGSTRDHIFYIVSVTRTVYVRIVTVSRRILNVRCIDGNTPFLFFRSSIDIIIFFFASANPLPARIEVIAAVKVVLPWST